MELGFKKEFKEKIFQQIIQLESQTVKIEQQGIDELFQKTNKELQQAQIDGLPLAKENLKEISINHQIIAIDETLIKQHEPEFKKFQSGRSQFSYLKQLNDNNQLELQDKEVQKKCQEQFSKQKEEIEQEFQKKMNEKDQKISACENQLNDKQIRIENLIETNKDLEQKLTRLEKSTEEQKKQLQDQKYQKNKDIQELQNQLVQAYFQIKELQDSNQQEILNKDLTSQTTIKELKKRMEKKDLQIINLQGEKWRLSEGYDQKIIACENELNDKKNRIENLIETNKDLEQKLKRMEKSTEEQKNQLQDQKDQKNKDIQELQNQLVQANFQIKELQDSNYQEILDKDLTYQTIIKELNKIMEKKDLQIINLQGEKSRLSEGYDQKIIVCQNELNDKKKRIENLIETNKDLEQKLKRMGKSTEEQKKQLQEQKDQKNNDIYELQNQLVQANFQIKELKDSNYQELLDKDLTYQKIIQEMKESMENKDQQLRNLQDNYQKLFQENDLCNKKRKELKKKKATDKRSKNYQIFQQKIADLDDFKNNLRKYQV